jgi:hypothetical protein
MPATPNWRENLPPKCPPDGKDGAAPLASQVLLRLTKSENFQEGDFDSYAAMGMPCLNERLCEWSGCSMFLASLSKAHLNDLRGYPNLRHMKVVAFVEVDQNSGVGKISRSKHVTVWMYKDYKPTKHIAKWVPIDDFE